MPEIQSAACRELHRWHNKDRVHSLESCARSCRSLCSFMMVIPSLCSILVEIAPVNYGIATEKEKVGSSTPASNCECLWK